ncbi:MAG: TolC family protein [Draconibacterium sp.]
MKTIFLLLLIITGITAGAQEVDTSKTWSLNDCISYALNQNVAVRKSNLVNLSNQINAEEAQAQKLPSVSASVRQNFNWANSTSEITGEKNFTGSNNSSYTVNSSIVIYNASKLNNLIKQAQLDLESGKYDSETVKESVTLSILSAYLQVLFNEEQVKNAKNQMDATSEQLGYSEERLTLGIISKSDYLQVKSQLATEKLNLANAQSQLSIAKVNLMQLIELPVNSSFKIAQPDLGKSVNQNLYPMPLDVYNIALGIKPQIKSAEYQKESAALNEKVAAAGFYPTLSADAGIGTGYNVHTEQGYFGQLSDQVSPSVGFSLSIPIFQKKQVKSSVAQAKISYQNAELQEIDTKNQLRKEIEQVCVDVISSQTEYEASIEQYESTLESYNIAEEKFNNGLINSVDFLFEKTNLITAESQLLQSKFSVIFNYKILDFYTGTPIEL